MRGNNLFLALRNNTALSLRASHHPLDRGLEFFLLNRFFAMARSKKGRLIHKIFQIGS